MVTNLSRTLGLCLLSIITVAACAESKDETSQVDTQSPAKEATSKPEAKQDEHKHDHKPASSVSIMDFDKAASMDFKEGVHYDVLEEPQPTRDASKIEVVELFWYGCPHCYKLEPYVHAWEDNMPKDADFWQSPAIFSQVWALHAQAFYAAKALGVLDKIHTPFFEEIHKNKKRLANQNELADFFAKHGVEKADFDKAWNSFGVKTQVKQADARARNYKVSGVPAVVVNGKYRVSSTMQAGESGLFDVVNFLIAKEQK